MEVVRLQGIDGTECEAQVLDVSEVVALEQRIAAEGTPLLELMKRAGRALADVVMARVGADARVVVLAGSGNNGGDGWVAARILADVGYQVVVVTKVVPAELQAEPVRTAALEAIASGGFEIEVDPGEVELKALLDPASVIVDAILGTGFAHDEVREPYAIWIDLANAAREGAGAGDVSGSARNGLVATSDEAAGSARHRDEISISPMVVAADCPSGLNAQTGSHATQCLVADITVTMLTPKRGLVAPNAAPFIGELLLADLS